MSFPAPEWLISTLFVHFGKQMMTCFRKVSSLPWLPFETCKHFALFFATNTKSLAVLWLTVTFWNVPIFLELQMWWDNYTCRADGASLPLAVFRQFYSLIYAIPSITLYIIVVKSVRRHRTYYFVVYTKLFSLCAILVGWMSLNRLSSKAESVYIENYVMHNV